MDMTRTLIRNYTTDGYTIIHLSDGRCAVWLPRLGENWSYKEELRRPVENLRLNWQKYLIETVHNGQTGDAIPLDIMTTQINDSCRQQ